MLPPGEVLLDVEPGGEVTSHTGHRTFIPPARCTALFRCFRPCSCCFRCRAVMHSTPQSPHGTVGFFFAAAGRGGLGADHLRRSAGVAAFVVAGGAAAPWLLAIAGGGREDVPGARWAFGGGCGGTCCGCAGAA